MRNFQEYRRETAGSSVSQGPMGTEEIATREPEIVFNRQSLSPTGLVKRGNALFK